MVSEKLKGSEAKFKFNSNQQTWRGVNCDLVPTEMLEAAKAMVVNKGLDNKDDTEELNMKVMAARLMRIEETLEKISEKLTQMS